MIHLAIKHLANQLNQFLKRSLTITEDIVVVSNLIDQDGSLAPNLSNKIVMFLTRIERDTMPFRTADGMARTTSNTAPIYLNLYVMVAANFTANNYPDALKFISDVIGFFRKQAIFDRYSTPDLDQKIEKLILDIENLTIHEMSNVWGLLGCKYLPSVLYRVRMVALDADDIQGRVPLVAEPDVLAQHLAAP